MVFLVIMYGYKSWSIKKAERWIDTFELWSWRRLDSPLDSMEIKPVNPKGNQPWIFIFTDDKAEAPILWLPDVKSWLIGKNPDAGKDWGQEEKGTTEDEKVGWHHWLSGHEFELTLGVGDGQGSLACCSPWGHKQSDVTWRLNNSNKACVLSCKYHSLSPHHSPFSIYVSSWQRPPLGIIPFGSARRLGIVTLTL